MMTHDDDPTANLLLLSLNSACYYFISIMLVLAGLWLFSYDDWIS